MKRITVSAISLLLFFACAPSVSAYTGSITVGENLPVRPAYILAGMFIGAVAGVLSVHIAKNRLKSVSFRSEADDYLKNGSFNLTESKDNLIDINTSRTLRLKKNSIIDELNRD